MVFRAPKRSVTEHGALVLVSRSIVVAIIFLFTAVLSSQIRADKKPEIFVKTPAHDFGLVRQQERFEHSFLIQNRGRADLVIEDIHSTCDCTTEDITGRQIAANASTPLTVVLETRGYEGPQRRIVELKTNDPQSPTVRLEVMARVCSGFAILPRSLVLTEPPKGVSFEGDLRLAQCSEQLLHLSEVDTSVPWLSSSWEHVSAANGGGYVVHVRVKGSAPVGQHAEVISLHLDQGGRSIVDVPIFVQKRN